MAIHSDGRSSVHLQRHPYNRGEVCRFFLQGRCNRSRCRFLHPTTNKQRSPVPAAGRGMVWRNPNLHGVGKDGYHRKKENDKNEKAPAAGTEVNSSSFAPQSCSPVVESAPVITTVLGAASVLPQKTNASVFSTALDAVSLEREASSVNVTSALAHKISAPVEIASIAQEISSPEIESEDEAASFELEFSALAVNSALKHGFSSPAVSCEIDADDSLQVVICGDVDHTAATQEPYSRHNQLLEKVIPCSFFLNGSNCEFGETCRNLHSWSIGAEDFLLVAVLEGNRKPIKGIALPPNSTNLYISSCDAVTTWDCPTGQRTSNISPGCEVSCLVGDEGWLFLGLPGVIKAWNSETKVNLSFNYYPADRQVNALVIGNVNGDHVLFAGLSDGGILAWRWTPSSNTFEPDIPATSAFAGAHSLGILTLVVGGERLYSGSMDRTIKVWLLPTLNCLQILTGHSDAVTSLICFDKYLLSGSLDGAVKVWGVNGYSLELEVICTHSHEARVVTLGGISDAGKTRHVLMCSCDDSTVYLYDLPSFSERGRIFSRDEVRHIVTGPDRFFFIGNAAGDLQVWRWSDGSAG